MPTITGPVVGMDSAAANRLAQIVQSFESSWQSNTRPRIDDFLKEPPELRSALLAELAVLDLEFRLRAGENARAEEYLQQYAGFPNDAIPDLVEAEYRGRRPREPELDANEFLERFPSNRSTLADRLQLTAPAQAAHERISEILVIPGYEIRELVGRGATGHVFKALDQRLGRLVAIKLLGDDADADQRERFRRESTAAAQLHHSNIVGIYEVGATKSGRPYLVLEFVPGGTLQTKLLAGPMTPGDSAAALEIVAQAVAHAHQHGVIHRDLKPANILVGLTDGASTAQWKIADFGLARTTNSPMLTKTGVVIGTPAYMAPEQADGQDATERSDVYALGAILYECLVGRPPFRGATVLETLDQVRRREPVRIRELQPSVPPDLETIALKCLSKEPQRRYASAQALADDLARFRAGQPIQARPVSTWQRGLMWARRNPLVAGLTGSIAALLVIMTIGAIGFAIRQNHLAFVADQNRLDADQAAEKERKRRVELRSTLDRMTSMALADITQTGPMNQEQREFFTTALKQYEAFAQEPGATPSDQLLAAQAAGRVADIQRRLGDYGAAAEMYRQASDTMVRLHKDRPDNAAVRLSAMITKFHYAMLLERKRQLPEAAEQLQQVIELARTPGTVNQNAQDNTYSNALVLLAKVYRELGRISESRDLLHQAMVTLDNAPEPNRVETKLARLNSIVDLVIEAEHVGDEVNREKLTNQALPLAEWLEVNVPNNPDVLSVAAQTYAQFAALPANVRQTGLQEKWLDRSIQATRAAVRLMPFDAGCRIDLATKIRRRANLERDPAQAVTQLKEAVELLTWAARQRTNDFHANRLLAQTLSQLGLYHTSAKQVDDARSAYDQSAELFEKLFAANPDAWEPAVGLGGLLVNRAVLEMTASGSAAALPMLSRAIELLEKAAANPAASANAKLFLRKARFQRARALTDLQEFTNALADWDAALATQPTTAEERNLRIYRADTFIRKQDYEQAHHEITTTLALPAATNNDRWLAAKVFGTWSLDDRDTEERRAEAQRKSVELILQLHKAGFFRDPNNVADLQNGRQFESVRTDPRVQAILQTSAGRAGP